MLRFFNCSRILILTFIISLMLLLYKWLVLFYVHIGRDTLMEENHNKLFYFHQILGIGVVEPQVCFITPPVWKVLNIRCFPVKISRSAWILSSRTYYCWLSWCFRYGLCGVFRWHFTHITIGIFKRSFQAWRYLLQYGRNVVT